MLATFVIGLREGLEAALIVGIIAAFLRQHGRRDLLGRVWIGVALAATLCLVAGIALQLFNASLPQREQEQLETVVGVAAVAMVSYMVIWMHRSRARAQRPPRVRRRPGNCGGLRLGARGDGLHGCPAGGARNGRVSARDVQASQNAELASLGAAPASWSPPCSATDCIAGLSASTWAASSRSLASC